MKVLFTILSISAVGFLIIIAGLYPINVHLLVEHNSFLKTLLNNILLLENTVKNHILLIILVIILFSCFFIKSKYKITLNNVSLMGANFELKNYDKKFKIDLKNYLCTKRTIFVFNSEYDNLYDVLNSYFEIYIFIREQIQSIEDRNESTTFKKAKDSIVKLNVFLTRYQSNYRRFYELKTETSNMFITFQEIQKSYNQFSEIIKAIKQINDDFADLALYLGIDTSVWSELKEKIDFV